MVLFSVYAVIVWFAAARYRRRWASYASVAGGVAGLVLVAFFHIQLSRWTQGRIFLPQLQMMLYPYIGLVALVGVYLCCLPRSIAVTACEACEYDLRGLSSERPVCPECGREAAAHQRAVIGRVGDCECGDPAPPADKRAIRARLARRHPRPASGPAGRGLPAIAGSPVLLDPDRG